MMKIKNKYPKAWKAYKDFLFHKYEGNKQILDVITDDILEVNLNYAPMSATFYFDTVNLIGTINYNSSVKMFEVNINGFPIEVKKQFLRSVHRIETEQKLINYLFSEVEKTL